MKSTKIATALALFAVISTSLTVSARPCYDENGNEIRCGVVRGSTRVVGNAGEGALNVITLGGHERRKENDKRRDAENKKRRTEERKAQEIKQYK